MMLTVNRASLRYGLRLTVAALLAYALTQFFMLPLHGLWAVLTAVVVIQMSVGGSLKATIEYVLGTCCGAIYASAVGVLVPHATPLATAGVLALAIAPLAYLAAHNANFRVAPFTAVIVLLLAGQFHEGPITAALVRSGEVVLGGAVAIFVSLVFLPERTQSLGAKAAARALDKIVFVLPAILKGFTEQLDPAYNQRLQDEVGASVATFQNVMGEAHRERMVPLSTLPDPGPLVRTVVRLRHDIVIFGRASASPLPKAIDERLAPAIDRIAQSMRIFLSACSKALAQRKAAPDTKWVEKDFDALAADVAKLRQDGLTRPLDSGQVEQLFALSFAMEELRQHCRDLVRCADDWAGS